LNLRLSSLASFATLIVTSAFATTMVAAGCGSSVDVDDGDGGCDGANCSVTCDVGGTLYQVGESVPGECASCTCQSDGSLACPAIDCIGPVCEADDGTIHPVGDTWQEACNTCECLAGAETSCTEIACPEGDCVYGGETYAAGESFPSLDGCNSCTCAAGGGIACTGAVCACDPDSEWWREYVGDSPEECMVIDFACPENTTMFGNECGCGCEQSAACPQTFDCQPPTPCDIEAISSECPYSVIAL
jgi:hypothetical protein